MMKDLVVRLAPMLLVLLLGACADDAAPPSDPVSGSPEAIESAPLATESVPVVTEAVPVEVDDLALIDPKAASASEIDWDSLIPEDFRPDKLMEKYDLDALEDDDPRVAEVMAEMKALWDQAPVREDLDGAEVKLPGFVVPVEADAEETTGFLLVPYYGACVHVPPPPANQTVYVQTEAGQGTAPKLFDVVEVTGTLRVERVVNELAAAGYTLHASNIEPYEE